MACGGGGEEDDEEEPVMGTKRPGNNHTTMAPTVTLKNATSTAVARTRATAGTVTLIGARRGLRPRRR